MIDSVQITDSFEPILIFLLFGFLLSLLLLLRGRLPPSSSSTKFNFFLLSRFLSLREPNDDISGDLKRLSSKYSSGQLRK